MEVAKTQKQRKKRRRGQVLPLGGGSFKIRMPLGREASGRRKYHTETLHNTTPTGAEKRCMQILAEVDSGAYFEPSRTRVKDFIEKEWLPQKRREGVREASSMRAYEGVVSWYVVPAIGHLPLSRVTPQTAPGDAAAAFGELREAASRRPPATNWHA